MKRSAKSASDIDLRGRVRRHPSRDQTPATRTKEIKLIGGPMDGRRITLPANAEMYQTGPKGGPFFAYSYAGKLDAVTYFAIRPKSRRERRMLWAAIGALGRDPRVENRFHQTEPHVLPRTEGGRKVKPNA